MKKYIEREEVLKHKRKMSGADFGGEFWDEAVLCEDIRKIPTADVEPVRHGEWMEVGGPWVLGHKCSICNYYNERTLMRLESTPYCPNCGAKMNGGNK